MKSSEKYGNSTSEIDSDIFSEQEVRNLPKIPSNLKLRHETNGFIEGKMKSFGDATNIGQRSSHCYKFLSDESTGDDLESIGQDRMSSNHADYRRFKWEEKIYIMFLKLT